MEIIRIIRFSIPGLLLLHILIGRIFAEATQFGEIYLYNTIIFLIIFLMLRNTREVNMRASLYSSIAIILWACGSLLSSISSFYYISEHSQIVANFFYLLFYPFALIGFPRLVLPERNITFLEILDSSIIGLGLSSLLTAFVIKPVLPHFDGNFVSTFFSICFPIADVILITVTGAAFLTQLTNSKSLYLCGGIIVFALSDFTFLWESLHRSYRFGSLVDSGWLIALALIGESFWHQSGVIDSQRNINPILLTISVFFSSTLLALLALHPGYFPTFILLPTVSTLLLAFLRMAIALKEARNIGEERILARTDELTGLPNRRKLISELVLFESKDGALLLLDLDGFKPVNDTHGHEVGDLVLQQVASRFERALPPDALLARLGGDEFGVILQGSYERTMEVALALHATLSYPFLIREHNIHIGVSIGHITNDGSQDLLRKADLAMYEAKKNGLGVFAG